MRPTFPDALLDLVDGLAARQLAAGASDDRRLADAVRGVSHGYTRDRGQLASALPDERALEARLRFFLPRDLPKLWGPLDELQRAHALPGMTAATSGAVRVLDVGCGLGTTTLAVAHYYANLPETPPLRVTAIDRDARALALMEALVRESAPAVELSARQGELPRDLPHEVDGYDLVVAGLVVNELTESQPTEDARLSMAVDLVQALVGRLAPGGVLIVVEPALRPQARQLQRVRDALAMAHGAPHVFAPCTHAAPCPLLSRKRDWCHERVPASLPARLATVARAAGLRDGDLSYSYLTLTDTPAGSAALCADPARVALRAVSGPLRTKGKVELDVCGPDGSLRLMQLRRDAKHSGARLDALGRGAVISLRRDDLPRRDAGGDAGGARRLRLRGEELRVHQAWSTSPSVIDPDG